MDKQPIPTVDDELPVETLPDVPDEEEVEGDEEDQADDAEDASEEDQEEVADDQGDGQEEEYVTVTDDSGTEYEVPKSLAGAFMKERDYRQKTQSLAEARRQFEAERQQWAETQKRDEEDFKLASEVYSLDQQLKQYEGVDWNQLDQQDPDASQRHWRQYQMLRQRKEDLGKAQSERHTQKSQQAQQELAKRVDQTREYAEANIPNWSDGLLNEIEDYAVNKAGMTREAIVANLSPAFLQVLHDAFMAQKIKEGANKPKRVIQPVKPVRQIKAKSSGTNRIDLADASMEDYQRLRRQGANPRLT